MKIGRATTIPIVTGTVACLALLAYVTTGICVNEFKYAKRTLDRVVIPALAELCKSLYPHFWVLPLVAFAAGLVLCVRREISSTAVAWYVTCFTFIGLAMALLTLLTWYLLSTVLRG
jgi:hypothetical protein